MGGLKRVLGGATACECGNETFRYQDYSDRLECTACYKLETRSPVWELPPDLPPTAARMVARVMAFGAVKYKGHESYLTDGRSIQVHLDAAERHIKATNLGELLDHESGQHPLAHTAARILMALEMELRKDPG